MATRLPRGKGLRLIEDNDSKVRQGKGAIEHQRSCCCCRWSHLRRGRWPAHASRQQAASHKAGPPRKKAPRDPNLAGVPQPSPALPRRPPSAWLGPPASLGFWFLAPSRDKLHRAGKLDWSIKSTWGSSSKRRLSSGAAMGASEGSAGLPCYASVAYPPGAQAAQNQLRVSIVLWEEEQSKAGTRW